MNNRTVLPPPTDSTYIVGCASKPILSALFLTLIIVLLAFTSALAQNDAPLVFPDLSPLSVRLSDTYVTETTVFLQNNTTSALDISFHVIALDSRGPIRFECTTEDRQPLQPGELRAFRLRIYTTSKEKLSERTNLSSNGYLIASVETNPSVKTAFREIRFYLEPEALIGPKKFIIPFALTLIVIMLAGLRLSLYKHIYPSNLMKEVPFDPKQTGLSNFVIGTSILNSVIGLGTLDATAKTEVTALTGLFVLLILIGPLFYNLTLRSRANDQNVGWVWAFLVACGFTLMGGYGALATAFLVFDYFTQTYLISESIYRFFQVLLVIIVGVVSLYALRAIDRTVITQYTGDKEDLLQSSAAVPNRSSLL